VGLYPYLARSVCEEARAFLVKKMDADTVIHHLILKTVLFNAK
jgi:hypothetical protein